MIGIIFCCNSAYSSNSFKIKKKMIIIIIMNGRNRNSCRQIFKKRIQKFILLTLDLVLTYILTATANIL